MEYQKFKESIRDRLQEELGEGKEVSFHDLRRNNGVKIEGLEVRDRAYMAAPILHLDELYEGCRRSGRIEDAVSMAIRKLEERAAAPMGAVPTTWEEARGGIRARLVHYGWNREALKGIPHRKFLNLAVTYYAKLPESGGFQTEIRIDTGLMGLWEATEGMLHQAAMENMEQEPYHIQPLAELVGRMTGIPAGEMPEISEGMGGQYALTNESGHYGAAGMLRQGLMEGFARQAGGSFYILPSSVHDLILMPDTPGICAEELKRMVKEVNESTVAWEEWLSEDVYYYDCKEKKVRIVA